MRRFHQSTIIRITRKVLDRKIPQLFVLAVLTLNSVQLWADQQAAVANPSMASSGPAANATARNETPEAKPGPAPSTARKLGPLTITVNWRFRVEAWDWFQPSAGQSTYGLEHSLLKIGVGQKSEAFDWFLEAAQDAILGLPNDAVQPGRLGQLGLGGTYFLANGNSRNNVDGFVKQAYFGFKLPKKAGSAPAASCFSMAQKSSRKTKLWRQSSTPGSPSD